MSRYFFDSIPAAGRRFVRVNALPTYGIDVIRSFEDREGGQWDVTVGRASWGAFYALFVPRGGDQTRQVLLPVDASDEAARFLGKIDDEGMGELFRRSEPRPSD